MPQHNRATYLAYQRGYYARHKKQLARRAKLRQRLVRGTPTLWSILSKSPRISGLRRISNICATPKHSTPR